MNETNPTTQAVQAQAVAALAKMLKDMGDASIGRMTEYRNFCAEVDRLAALATPSQPSDGESVGAQPAMDWQPRQVRMERTKGSTIAEMRAGLSRDLYNTGDCILCWVNEGDCLMHLPAAPTKEQGQAK